MIFEKEKLCNNLNQFMWETLRKALLVRLWLKNCFNKQRTNGTWRLSMKQRNFCTKVLKKLKKYSFSEKDPKVVFYNKPDIFWQSICSLNIRQAKFVKWNDDIQKVWLISSVTKMSEFLLGYFEDITKVFNLKCRINLNLFQRKPKLSG